MVDGVGSFGDDGMGTDPPPEHHPLATYGSLARRLRGTHVFPSRDPAPRRPSGSPSLSLSLGPLLLPSPRAPGALPMKPRCGDPPFRFEPEVTAISGSCLLARSLDHLLQSTVPWSVVPVVSSEEVLVGTSSFSGACPWTGADGCPRPLPSGLLVLKGVPDLGRCRGPLRWQLNRL